MCYKAALVVFVLCLVGCIGPATERLKVTGERKDQIFAELRVAENPQVIESLREELASIKSEETALLTEATNEREEARKSRGTLFGIGATLLTTVVGMGVAAAKKVVTGGVA